MPNYSAAIPPGKLDISGMRRLYDKIAEFLPVYLNYNKMEPAISRGDFSSITPLDAIDVVPMGKTAALAAKLAPAGAMVINPKTINKFVETVKNTKDSINLHIDPSVTVNNKFINNLKEVMAIVKTRYPHLFNRLEKIKVRAPRISNELASYVPSELALSFTNKDINKEDLLRVALHELRHFAQDVYNNPAHALFKVADYNKLNYFDPADIKKYKSAAEEVDANAYSRVAANFINEVIRYPKEFAKMDMGTLNNLKKRIKYLNAYKDLEEFFRSNVINELGRKFMQDIPNFSFRRFEPVNFNKLPSYLTDIKPNVSSTSYKDEAEKLFNKLLQLQDKRD